MGFNYRKERKRFEEQMIEMEKKYHAAGMSDEQIAAMREYEEEQFRRERIYKIHIVLEESKEYPRSVDQEAVHDLYFYEVKRNLDTLLENLLPGASSLVSNTDKYIILMLIAGCRHREIAQEIGITQQGISKRINKIRKILKNRL